MYRPHSTWLAVAVVLAATTLAAPTQSSQAARLARVRAVVALSVGVSETTGHIFVVNTLAPSTPFAGPSQSWVSMLDARSYESLRVIPVPSGAVQVLVSDRTGRAFVIHAYGPFYPTSVTVLNTKTGAVLRQVTAGKGLLIDPILASGARHLFLVTSPLEATNVFKLHVLDTATGQQVRVVTVPYYVLSGAVDERSGRLFLAGSKTITVYDSRSLRTVMTIPVQEGSSLLVPGGWPPTHLMFAVATRMPGCMGKATACGGELNKTDVYNIQPSRSVFLRRHQRDRHDRNVTGIELPDNGRVLATQIGEHPL